MDIRMRDPERIQRILRRLEAVWELNPDLRLGQLLLNVVNPDDFNSLWNLEDDVLEELIQEWIK